MSLSKEENKTICAHHEQLPLCTTRLPYRQGRKLTAVKVYTINSESNHLLVFGVPSINLRQETKALFSKYGTLLSFTLSKNHPGEKFTETYHARFEKIQSARIAKRMVDTKNFYGGTLHVCYAPELESVEETRNKFVQRQKDVINRLKNLQKETKIEKVEALRTGNKKNVDINNSLLNQNAQNILIINELDFNIDNKIYQNEDNIYQNPNPNTSTLITECNHNKSIIHKTKDKFGEKINKINMCDENIIYLNKNKRKTDSNFVIEKKFKSYKKTNRTQADSVLSNDLEIVDCTSIHKKTVSNIKL